MNVTDHNKYRKFNYENDLTNPNFELGQVVIYVDKNGNPNDENGNPIGVVIQLHDDGDCRVDMFGNTSTDEVRLATLKEIKKFRIELIDEILPIPFKDVNLTFLSNGNPTTKRAFYSDLFKHYAIPPSWQKFNGKLLPHGFGGERIKPNEIINWSYCKD